jgi:hypothetical protein
MWDRHVRVPARGPGVEVVAVDPAGASLDVARSKPGRDRVRWLHGDATSLPSLQVDLATMTANVAQVFVTDAEWNASLEGVRSALRAEGRFVFETRDPARKAWLEWDRTGSYQCVDVPEVGRVHSWTDVTEVRDGLVSFRGTYVFDSDGAVLTSESTLRFRTRDEVAESLREVGMIVDDVRDAPDRPGREFVFIARKPG